MLRLLIIVSLLSGFAVAATTKKPRPSCKEENKEVRLSQLRLELALQKYSSCIEGVINP